MPGQAADADAVFARIVAASAITLQLLTVTGTSWQVRREWAEDQRQAVRDDFDGQAGPEAAAGACRGTRRYSDR
jgi:hypothetical protein